MARALWILVAAATLAGCGGGEPQAAADPSPSATSTPTPIATPKPPVRARNARQCLQVWNADEAIGSTYQVSHTDFMAELAKTRRTPVFVVFEHHNCYVEAPVGRRRIAWFAAWDGHAPYTIPKRRNLKPREYVPYNGHALRDGRIAMD
jgi:hypothetical protein